METTEYDCGVFTGLNMESGKLVINGNVNNDLGIDLKGGTIIVNGNVHVVYDEPNIGAGMEGGTIIINGDVSAYDKLTIGGGMTGGTIIFNGEIPDDVDFSQIKHGKIYHKGELIVDK